MMQSPIRVAHLLPNLALGGAERVAVHILSALDRRRFVPSAIVFRGPSDTQLKAMLADRGILVTFLGKRPGFDPRAYFRVLDALRCHRPDVVHTHMQVLLYALPALKLLRPSLAIHTVHNLAEHEVGRELRWVQRLSFRTGVVPVAVARRVQSSLRSLYGLSHIPLIPNGIPVSEYASSSVPRDVWRGREGFCPDDLLLVSVGRLARQKNCALLLDAFANLIAAHPRARLVLAGTGKERPALEARANQLCIASKVRFLGLRNDIPDLLGAMDLFALSSDWEGNPLCIMEAMAAGLPVVGTSVGGVPELVQSGSEGFLVPRGDVRALTEALALLLRDSNLRKVMGAAAANRARADFDVSLMADAYAALYESSVARPLRALDAVHPPATDGMQTTMPTA